LFDFIKSLLNIIFSLKSKNSTLNTHLLSLAFNPIFYICQTFKYVPSFTFWIWSYVVNSSKNWSFTLECDATLKLWLATQLLNQNKASRPCQLAVYLLFVVYGKYKWNSTFLTYLLLLRAPLKRYLNFTPVS
jgi:hypothetical protein